ncbi:hypothetical protein [Frigidibacter sp. MR17.24]|uniref:hypothetical protein n=1 Tax=Frigidibacter sp. MR17.24 TaxID=3127345 RepID=UPI003012A93F
MGKHAVPTIPKATKRDIDEWLAKGYDVDVRADGSIGIKHRAAEPDDFDRIDFRR